MSLLPLATRVTCAFLFFFCVSQLTTAQNVLYVNHQNVSPGNGLSWSAAFDNIQDALTAANANGTIRELWIAQGIYSPTIDNDAADFWNWRDSLSAYGGFIGSETEIGQRNPAAYPTIFDANIGDPNVNTDNSLNLLSISNPTAEINISGVTFQNTGSQVIENSGAIKVSYSNNLDSATVLIDNCIFNNNFGFSGAAIAIEVNSSSYSALQIQKCIFNNNSATEGGAISLKKNSESILEIGISDCWFKENQAVQGGAIWGGGDNGNTPDILEWNAEILNGIFIDNQASRGGALYFEDSSSQFIGRAQNCTFYDNVSSINGSSIYLGFNGGGEFVNNIHWGEANDKESIFFTINDGNLSVAYSLMNNPFTGGTNMVTGDPMFFAAEADDFRLKICSDAINKGNNYGLPATDTRGAARQYESQLDLGAYEMDGSEIILLPATASGESAASRWITDPAGWTHYTDCNNQQRLISLNTDGQNIGTPGIDDFNVAIVTDSDFGVIGIDLTDADYFAGPGNFIANRRYWKVSNATPFANPIRLRFYFTAEDLTDIQTLADESIGLTALQPFKVTGDDAFALDINAQGGIFENYIFSNDGSANAWTQGTAGGVDYVEFAVSSFSSGAIGYNDQNGLPVSLVEFSAAEEDFASQLNWVTQLEENLSHFEIQRSDNEQNYRALGKVMATAETAELGYYQYMDTEPNLIVNYYRLKMVDYDGSYKYSDIVKTSFSDLASNRWILFPNPVDDELNIILPPEAHGNLRLELLDSKGQLLSQKQMNYNGDRLFFPVENLTDGTYFIRAVGRWINENRAFVKMNKK